MFKSCYNYTKQYYPNDIVRLTWIDNSVNSDNILSITKEL